LLAGLGVTQHDGLSARCVGGAEGSEFEAHGYSVSLAGVREPLGGAGCGEVMGSRITGALARMARRTLTAPGSGPPLT
jgi:hypothetical protein